MPPAGLRILAARGDAGRMRGLNLGQGDLPVVVGVEPAEQSCRAPWSALGHLLVELRLLGRELVLRDEAVPVQVEFAECLLHPRGDVCAGLVRCEKALARMSALRGRRWRRRALGRYGYAGAQGGNKDAAKDEL